MVFTNQIKNIKRFAKLSATDRLECCNAMQTNVSDKGGMLMTRNQIEYNKLLETRRSNMASEKLTAARDTETARHNLAGEGLQAVSLDLQREGLGETKRANRAQEGLRAQELTIRQSELAETHRANVAREGLTGRQIDVQYATGMASAAAHRYAAELSSSASRYATDTQAKTQAAQLAETKRANTMNAMNNVARVIQTGVQQAETKRHNKAQERLTESQQLEVNRHNVVTEHIQHSGTSSQNFRNYAGGISDVIKSGLSIAAMVS